MVDDKKLDSNEIHWLERFAFLIAIFLLFIPLVVLMLLNIRGSIPLDSDIRVPILESDLMMPIGQVVALSAVTSGLLRLLGGMKNTPESKVRAIYLETLGALAGTATAIAAVLVIDLTNVLVLLALFVSMSALIMAWVATIDWPTRISELGRPFLYSALGLSALGLTGTTISIAAIKLWCEECPSICLDLQIIAALSLFLLVAPPAALGFKVLYLFISRRSVLKEPETEPD